MKRFLVAVVCVLGAPAALAGSAAARPDELSCGVADPGPAWIDFADGSVSFWRERFARPGVIVATGGPDLAAEARTAGAATVHWDMHLRKRVGTPSEPADADLMQRRADSLFDYAVSVSGCERPLIALNELWGASLPTPVTPTAERYRANVLRFVTRLSERGARPAVLVSSEPFTGGDAAAWWRAVGQVSDIVLEKYANANLIWRDGAVDGSRRLRTGYRASTAKLFAIGIPPSRVGLMIGFQTGAGAGGREGLQPRSRWFDVAKWQAFAAEQVSRELRLSHVWSWGWAQRNERSNDPDKTYAACVWLWARDEGLCDAPNLLGKELDSERRAGQIDLPAGVRCVYDGHPLTASGVAALAKVTGDRELALTALVVRAVERERSAVGTAQILAMERRVIAARFSGSAGAYRAALAEAGASVAVARGIVGDELRGAEIQQRLVTPRPSSVDIGRFRATFARVSARRLDVSPAPSWLPEGSGLALGTSAPRFVFEMATRGSVTLRTAEGIFSVRALEDTASLGALPLSEARAAIARELVSERRADAYIAWAIRQRKAAESRLVCERERLPGHAVVSLSSFAPFLSIHEAAMNQGATFR
ncbi:MAG: hypothetical protein ACR2M2_00880 [Gaiellaceae bacterium]